MLALILRQGAVLAATGIGAGFVAAAAASRLLHGMLFGITPLDVPTFVGVAVVLGATAAFASLVPAQRATRIDPIVAENGIAWCEMLAARCAC